MRMPSECQAATRKLGQQNVDLPNPDVLAITARTDDLETQLESVRATLSELDESPSEAQLLPAQEAIASTVTYSDDTIFETTGYDFLCG